MTTTTKAKPKYPYKCVICNTPLASTEENWSGTDWICPTHTQAEWDDYCSATTIDPILAIMRAKMQLGSYYTKMDLMQTTGLPLAKITQALSYFKTEGKLKTRLCGSMYYAIISL